MKYLCLVFRDERKIAELSAAEAEALADETVAYTSELRRAGSFVASLTTDLNRQSTILRVRNGKLAITENPLATTGEQVTGLLVIEAVDLNDAIRVAAKLPEARLGSVDIRPLGDGSTDFLARVANRLGPETNGH